MPSLAYDLDMSRRQRVLILGASGFLGQKLYKFCKLNRHLDTYGTFFSANPEVQNELFYLDARNVSEVKKLVLNLKPRYILNCIALTNVDYCNDKPLTSKVLNLDFPIFLSGLCEVQGIKLIHLSTDHFASEELMPRTEEMQMRAVNVYGDHKLAADIHINDNNPHALILRTNFFGLESNSNKSFLDWVLNCYINRIEFTGYTNVYFSPLSLQELVKSIVLLVEFEVSGIVNLASDESVSKFDFIKIVGEELPADGGLLMPGLLRSNDTQAPRPYFMSLNNAKFKTLTNHQPPSLRSMIRAVLQEKLVG